MSDLISRQSAIVQLSHNKTGDDDCDVVIQNDIETIKELPPAQPERKKGEWIIEDDPRSEWYRVTSSECGEDVTSTVPMIGFFPNAKVLWDFCPYCGARMEVSDGKER